MTVVHTRRARREYQRPARRPRGWWALSASVVTVLQLAGTSHLAAVGHVICEHGDLLEVEEKSDSAIGEVLAPPSTTANSKQLQGSHEIRERASHLHCMVQARLRESVLRMLILTCQFCESSFYSSGINPQPSQTSLVLLRLAPKQSPPA
jgi:hypothetical protein